MVIKLFDKRMPESKKQIAELSTSTKFCIQNYDQIVQKNAEGISLTPIPVIEICNSIAVSAARGMFSIKLENTIYSNIILPLMDPKQLSPAQQTLAPV